MMRILDFLFARRPVATAGIAKERLQIVLAHERASRDAPDFLPALQRDLLAVVGRYVAIKEELLQVNFTRRDDASVLEINVAFDPAAAPARPFKEPQSANDARSSPPRHPARFTPARAKLIGKKR